MKLRHIFTINVFCAIFFGLTCLLVPRWLFSLYGSELGEAGLNPLIELLTQRAAE